MFPLFLLFWCTFLVSVFPCFAFLEYSSFSDCYRGGFRRDQVRNNNIINEGTKSRYGRHAVYSMLLDFGGKPRVPRSIKDAVTELKESLQAALSNKQSRMEINFPPGAELGVESTAKDSNTGGLLGNAMDNDKIEKADRELARLLVEMFLGPLGNTMMVVFPNDNQAKAASKKWNLDKGIITSMEFLRKKGIVMSSKKMKKVSKKKGKRTTGGFDQDTAILKSDDPIGVAVDEMEVMIVVSPSSNDILSLQSLSDEKGMGCAIILLNARLDEIEESKEITKEMKEEILNQYNLIFNLTPLNKNSYGGLKVSSMKSENKLSPQEMIIQLASRNILLYRKFPDSYYFVEKPKALLAPPKIILKKEERFDYADIYSIMRSSNNDGTEQTLEGSEKESNNLQSDLFSNMMNMFK